MSKTIYMFGDYSMEPVQVPRLTLKLRTGIQMVLNSIVPKDKWITVHCLKLSKINIQRCIWPRLKPKKKRIYIKYHRYSKQMKNVIHQRWIFMAEGAQRHQAASAWQPASGVDCGWAQPQAGQRLRLAFQSWYSIAAIWQEALVDQTAGWGCVRRIGRATLNPGSLAVRCSARPRVCLADAATRS